MTTLKLPKSVRRYVQPRDAEHEARLYFLWRMYRRSFSKGHIDSFGSASELEQTILGEIFEIPKEKWPSFRPRQRRVTASVVFAQLRALSKPVRKPKPSANKPQVQQKRPATIIRRPRPSGTS